MVYYGKKGLYLRSWNEEIICLMNKLNSSIIAHHFASVLYTDMEYMEYCMILSKNEHKKKINSKVKIYTTELFTYVGRAGGEVTTNLSVSLFLFFFL